MTTTRTAQQIRKEINELLATEVCVGHNEGTYSALEAGRKCGSGDPRFANRHEYETVSGEKRSTGPSPERAPGYMRYGGKARLAEYRQQLTALRAELKTAR
jgi:hypothetical protein